MPLFSRTAWQLFQQRDPLMFWVSGGLVLLGVLWRLEAWERSLRWLRLAMPLLSGVVAFFMAVFAGLHDLFGPCYFGSDGDLSLVGIHLIVVPGLASLLVSAFTLVLRCIELWRRGRTPRVARATS